MAVTLSDIARETGVDNGSISRILRNHPRAAGLSAETKERVMAAAKRLGYRRNELAATIRTGDNRTVAVIGRFDGAGPIGDASIVVAGVLKEATRLDYGVKIYSDDDLRRSFDEILRHQINHVLSLSVTSTLREETARVCRQQNLNLMFVYETAVGGFKTVTSAERDGVRDAVMKLAGQGHERIAFVCGPHRFSYVTERHDGYVLGLKAAGLVLDRRLVCCGESIAERADAVDRLLKMPCGKRPTAFMCIADSLALTVQRLAVTNKLRLPRDVSVIGFGNNELGEFAVCPINSIAQPFYEIGGTAFRLLAGEHCSLDPDAKGRYLLPTRLVERKSVAPPLC